MFLCSSIQFNSNLYKVHDIVGISEESSLKNLYKYIFNI